MRYLLFLSFFLLAVLPARAEVGVPAEWKICEQDADCRIVGHGCFIEAVHRAFFMQALNYTEEVNKQAKCKEYKYPDLFRAKCDFMVSSPACAKADFCPPIQGLCRAVRR